MPVPFEIGGDVVGSSVGEADEQGSRHTNVKL